MNREEAIKWINAFASYPKFPIKSYEALDMAIEAMQKPERPKGHWENGEPCPICGEDRFKDLYADIWADWKPPFCPNCGADMRGEEE